jgi:hypothetical protein
MTEQNKDNQADVTESFMLEDEQIDCGNGVTLHVRHKESPENPDLWVTVYFPRLLYFRTLVDAEAYVKANSTEIFQMTQGYYYSQGWISISGRTFETP